MSTAAEFAAKADETFAQLQALVPELKEAQQTDTARYDALKAETDRLAETVGSLKAQQEDAQRAEDLQARLDRIEQMAKDMASASRPASKAAVIGGNHVVDAGDLADSFFLNLSLAQNPKNPSDVRNAAEANLKAMGSIWMDVPAYSQGSLKATTGATDANGGYLAPRAVVADFTTVGVASNPYRSLLTVVTGIQGNTVDIPHIGLAPTRAAVVARGETKPNVDVSIANYTATFYTLAQIHDASNQWLRQTGGQGERLIRQRLGEAMGLGESYYILQGSGTSQPKGLLTSLGTSGTFVTSHTAAQTTIAGNFASGIAKAAGALADRNRMADGVVMNAGNFWTAIASGADAAGFFISPNGGPSTINVTGAFSNGSPVLSIWGLPVYADSNMPSDSLVVGSWKRAEMYVGADYRVDTSSEAGDRWDKNLTGFRAEEDIAFNADPYVVSGNFQRLIDTVA